MGILSCSVKKNVLSMKIMRLINDKYGTKTMNRTVFKNLISVENK